MISPRRLIEIHDDPYSATGAEIRWLIEELVPQARVCLVCGVPIPKTGVRGRPRKVHEFCQVGA